MCRGSATLTRGKQAEFSVTMQKEAQFRGKKKCESQEFAFQQITSETPRCGWCWFPSHYY